jgi:hypothetical protein
VVVALRITRLGLVVQLDVSRGSETTQFPASDDTEPLEDDELELVVPEVPVEVVDAPGHAQDSVVRLQVEGAHGVSSVQKELESQKPTLLPTVMSQKLLAH